MKILEQVTYQNTVLSVLVDAPDGDNKANASYFINDIEVVQWEVIRPIYQTLFTALLDEVCKRYKLEKWSY